MSASRNKLIPLTLLAFLAAPIERAWSEAAETVSENKDTDVIIPEPVQDTGGMMGARHDIGAVKAEELAPVSHETVGTLTASEGGLPIDMWKGTARDVVETYLPQLSSGPGARSPYDLQRRLLLTVAEVPPGLPGLGERETAGLLIRRVERLYAMGDWAEARQLLDMVPEKLRAESLIRYDVEARFQEHEDKLACDKAEPHLATGDDRFWSKAGVICSLIEGDKGHASLTLDMMREEKISDPYFFAIAESLLGVKYKKLPEPDELSTLRLMLLRLAKKPIPEGMLDKTTQPGLLKAIAQWPDFTADVRLAAARKAEAMGALATDVVRQQIEALAVTDKELAEATKTKGPRQAILLYRAAKANNSAEGRAEAIAKGLGAAGQGNALLAAMRLYAPLVAELPPGANLTWFAPTALRVLTAAGQAEKGKEWIPFTKPQGPAENKTGEALLLPVLRLMEAVPALELPHLQNWREALGKDAPAERATLVFGLLEALGDPVPTQLWLAEANAKAEPTNIPPTVWQGLKQAAQTKSPGQAALFSLLALDGYGSGGTSPLILQEVVRTLKAAGLEKEARALALEAAIAAGI
jgi:hypothetical protein